MVKASPQVSTPTTFPVISCPLAPITRKPLTTEDETALIAAFKHKFGWEPRPFQLGGIKAQIEGTDAIIQAATGAGKTAIVAGPYVLERYQDRCTIMVVPLLALETEMVRDNKA